MRTARKAISSGPALHRGSCRSCSPPDTHPKGQEGNLMFTIEQSKEEFSWRADFSGQLDLEGFGGT
jgi:hypothetical protein